jgi:hypothetical protein
MHATRKRFVGSAFLAGVFMICMCGLMLQIVQTRVISVIAWYQLAFLAIGMAMLGMTVGALLVYFKSAWFPASRLLENLVWICSAFSITVALSTFSLITTIVPASTASDAVMTLLAWFKLILVLVPPYVFAGMAISLALTRSRWPVQLVYGVDLLGAGSGCLLVLLLLNWADALSVLLAIGAFGAAAAACFATARRLDGTAGLPELPVARIGVLRRPLILLAVFAAIGLVNAAVQPHGLALMLSKGQLEFQRPAMVAWNSFSRILVGMDTVESPQLWGPSPTMPARQVSERALTIDGSAGTTMYRFSGALPEVDFLQYDITNLAYAIRHQGRAAVIGVGGGRDLLSAYLFGFRDVTGVELNPIFVDLLTHSLRSYNHVLDLPGVRLFNDEARSWFARATDRFDLIEMALVDTWAATGVGAYSMSENGLYTVQGWRNFLNALTPTGVFTVTRWYNPSAVIETGRLLSLAAAALRARGIERPQDHIFLAGTQALATLILTLSPLSADELSQLHRRTAELGFSVLLSPDQPPASPVLGRVLAATSPADFAVLAREFHLDFSVTTDDRPFFFNQLNFFDLVSFTLARQSGTGVAYGNLIATATIAIIIVLSGALVLVAMIVPALPSLRQVPVSLAALGTTYFLLIGLGFMFVEIGLIQRISIFLGHPVYGLAIGLFGIIVSTGMGSLIAGQMLRSGGAIVAWACLLGLYIAALPLWLPAVVSTFEGSSLLVRASVALAAIIPSGILMGFGFPTGMRLVNAVDPRPTPWFWAVNGAAGVLAASLAVTISVALSIDVCLWIGAGCYFLLGPVGMGLSALWLGQRVRMPQASG